MYYGVVLRSVSKDSLRRPTPPFSRSFLADSTVPTIWGLPFLLCIMEEGPSAKA
jgi:hypothetical protein